MRQLMANKTATLELVYFYNSDIDGSMFDTNIYQTT